MSLNGNQTLSSKLFKLQPNHWFAWQILPGYEANVPYFSPIFVYAVKPLKTGKGVLRVDFYNAFYAEGVKNFSLDLKVIKRSKLFLVGEILYQDDNPEERIATISGMSFDWLRLPSAFEEASGIESSGAGECRFLPGQGAEEADGLFAMKALIILAFLS